MPSEKHKTGFTFMVMNFGGILQHITLEAMLRFFSEVL